MCATATNRTRARSPCRYCPRNTTMRGHRSSQTHSRQLQHLRTGKQNTKQKDSRLRIMKASSSYTQQVVSHTRRAHRNGNALKRPIAEDQIRERRLICWRQCRVNREDIRSERCVVAHVDDGIGSSIDGHNSECAQRDGDVGIAGLPCVDDGTRHNGNL